VKFNDAQYFLPKPATAPSRPVEMANKKSLNEASKYDALSGEEEEEIKFNFKPRGTRTQKLKEESDEEVVFHFKQVATSKVWTMLKEINMSDSEEEIIFNFKPANTPQIQITETVLGEDSEEFDDMDDMTFEDENNDVCQFGKKNLTRRSYIISSRNPIKGLRPTMKVMSHL
jgi:hypothetical protein